MKEALDQACSAKKMLLEISQYSQGNTCVRASFLIKMQAWGLQETLAQVFSWKFYEISKNTFFTEHLRWLLLSGGCSYLHFQLFFLFWTFLKNQFTGFLIQILLLQLEYFLLSGIGFLSL